MTELPPAHVPFGTPEVPRIAVRGEVTLRVDPELVQVSVTVNARGTDRAATLEDLTRRNAAALQQVESFGTAVERVETGAFSVAPELGRRGRTERVRSYSGHVRLTVELSDFTVLGELVTRLADLELTEIEGPWWRLRESSPAYGEARRQAVRAAVDRAHEYAEAVGSGLTALLEIADEGSDGPQHFPAPAAWMAKGGYADEADAEQPALDLEPERQSVYAQVNARFTMSPPVLSRGGTDSPR
ncbi:SIMPL domain-containing protein [Streptomyces sp. NPDC050738]|uniref:SIMPL domain-containing protein n=1 Tax=Streptomyces sp. NPDC050738 TaxID=3154744 RepID=UPI00342E7899